MEISVSESIRQSLREKRKSLKFLQDEIVSLEIKLLISIREEDRESVYKVNKFEEFGNNVKGTPKKYRQDKQSIQMVDKNELKRLLSEVE
jgi:hypothetical protein